MGFFPSLPDKTNLADVFTAYPAGVEHLLAYHDVILRGPSPLSIAERELIAAQVSGLNRCRFCANAHQNYAEAYGIGEDAFDGLMVDTDAPTIPEKMKPILDYTEKLTLTPHAVGQADADAVFAAGWDERALHDAAVVCALFNFMNRVIHGAGVDTHDDLYAQRNRLTRKRSLERRRADNERHIGAKHYTQYGKQLGIVE
ncbi:MAG: peroxidase-related enzyme [Sphingomonadales bacterium]|nr:peroxidase-related enzyme [Sphingomonadales bacterium]